MTVDTQTLSRRGLLVGGVGLVVAGVAATPAFASADPVWTNFWGLAIRGYDPVAYFDQGAPVEGVKDHELVWNGATWRFASADALTRFEAAPQRYAPQYGGYCAWAVARGYTASVVPEAWEVVDDKLYLNYSLGVRAQWRQDIPGNIAKADANWPRVLEG